jgi:hypothetical protein
MQATPSSCIVSPDKDFNFESIRKKNKRVILINNGIHPGEPDGIDASMLLARDLPPFNVVPEKNQTSQLDNQIYLRMLFLLSFLFTISVAV